MFHKCCYAVVDVEALVITGVINVVEQAAVVIVDVLGREVLAEKYLIYQPYDAETLSRSYNIPLDVVQRSVDAYKRITGDNYIHRNKRVHAKWCDVRKRIRMLCDTYAVVTYAKGIKLEASVFYNEIDFQDLAWWGAPKYPLPVHDPLAECRYFSHWIPDTVKM